MRGLSPPSGVCSHGHTKGACSYVCGIAKRAGAVLLTQAARQTQTAEPPAKCPRITSYRSCGKYSTTTADLAVLKQGVMAMAARSTRITMDLFAML